MSEHKCVEWANRDNACIECGEHYTDCIDRLNARIDELEAKNKRLNAVLDRLADKKPFDASWVMSVSEGIGKPMKDLILEANARIEYARNRGEIDER